MKLFDLHCDTLYRAYTENSSLFQNDFHISLERAADIKPYIQCLAVWIPDEYRKNQAWELFSGCCRLLEKQLENTDIKICQNAGDIEYITQNQKQGVILTVEGGAVLGGDLSKVQTLYDMGVRMMTLTWNGRNELGDGIGELNDNGLTEFGKEVIREMERVGIIIDISHAGEKMFRQVAELAKKPFIASHSNIRTVSPHKRNLTEQQFCCLKERGGLAGINFCIEFLHKDKTNAKIYDIISVAEKFLNLGGENHIAIGADFDGADIPKEITGIESMQKIHELFLREFGKAIAEKIFFHNAERFFRNYFK